ncbi:MAG: MOSC domain-containing protein [Dehalococcoidia bacterium]|nr:MOSC domain-containing protein [Dehalococcoidia bacterium]
MATVGRVAHVMRFPVKSMRGEELQQADVSFQGLRGDRVYAFVQTEKRGPFPWLTARELPELVRFEPLWVEREGQPALDVRTPEGKVLPVEHEELLREVQERAGRPARLHSDHRGNQDWAPVSIITTSTIRALCEAAGVPEDYRRFRMNIVVETDLPPFAEAKWEGRTVRAGEVALAVTEQDLRCVIITLDPDSSESTPPLLKAASDMNEAYAGVYASVVVAGKVSVGDEVVVEG